MGPPEKEVLLKCSSLTRTSGDCVGKGSTRSGSLVFANGARGRGIAKVSFFAQKPCVGKRKKRRILTYNNWSWGTRSKIALLFSYPPMRGWIPGGVLNVYRNIALTRMSGDVPEILFSYLMRIRYFPQQRGCTWVRH